MSAFSERIAYENRDEGRLTDGKGRLVDFKQTVVILTSNLAAGKLLEDVAANGERDPNPHPILTQSSPNPLLDFFADAFPSRFPDVLLTFC